MERIVILGAGYAGLRCALDLADADIEAEIELIDSNSSHQLITWLHDVAAAAIPADDAHLPLRRILPDRIVFTRASVEAITPGEHLVRTSAGDRHYDRLVIALGSDTAWPPIPGVRENSFPLRWWAQAVELREHIEEQYARAAAIGDREERECHLRIMVAGGGFTGCQLAGELAHWLPALADDHDIDVMEIHLMLVEREDHLLPNWETWASRRAERVLTRKGVDVRVAAPLEAVTGSEVTFAGETVCTHTLVWTGGIRAPKLLEESGLPVGDQGRVDVDDFLRVPEYPEILVAGDCALALQENGTPVPANASYAVRQGEYVADLLIAEAHGRTLMPYHPSIPGILVSLGGDDAVGDALGIPLFGMPAGAIKDGVEQWYVSTVMRG